MDLRTANVDHLLVGVVSLIVVGLFVLRGRAYDTANLGQHRHMHFNNRGVGCHCLSGVDGVGGTDAACWTHLFISGVLM